MKSINYCEVRMNVRVRKHKVDTKRLCKLLRDNRGGYNNQEIADALNVSLTKAEHWFRQDKYFSIPEPSIWFDLKNLLGIETDEFDKPIMEFEEKPNVFEKGDRVYFTDMCSPTILISNDLRIIEVTNGNNSDW